MSYIFTSESVSEGHPDKLADQISDALVDEFLAFDPDSKVACETLVTTGQVVVAGEVKSKTYADVQEIVRCVVNNIGYTNAEYRFDGNSCGVLTALHEQSPDINRGVNNKIDPKQQGAGDQGMMFGYACRETDSLMPLPIELAHRLVQELSDIRREGKVMTYLRPDSKSQVSVEYNNKKEPVRIDTIVVSTQHDEFIKPDGNTAESIDVAEKAMLEKIKEDVKNILVPRVVKNMSERVQKLFDTEYILHVNPTGKFVIGGPHGDTGLTGRKIIVDTYGGRGAHGGGAFSGKDPSKVDRSAAYATRHIAKNMVAAGVADEMLVQLSYAIGVAEPVSVFVDTFATAKVEYSDNEIAKKIRHVFSLTPYEIEERLKLRNPIYSETAKYGHFGRTPKTIKKHFHSPYNGEIDLELELFTWEKLDYVDDIKKAFELK